MTPSAKLGVEKITDSSNEDLAGASNTFLQLVIDKVAPNNNDMFIIRFIVCLIKNLRSSQKQKICSLDMQSNRPLESKGSAA